MEKVINLGILHVAEQIFKSIDTQELFNFMEVSETWKVLAENVLLKRWKGKMFEACKSGKTKVVELLLENSVCEENEINIKDEDGMTGFMWACYFGHKDVVKLLLGHSDKLELNAKDIFDECTAFMHACRSVQLNVVKLLLDHPDKIELNAKDDWNMTAFMHACRYGHKDVVKLLLDYSDKVMLNARNDHGWTAWIFACYHGHKNIVELLLDHSDKIGLNAKDDNGVSAFMLTCNNGHKNIVELLLDHSLTKLS